MEKKIEFIGKIKRKIYDTENYKMYSVEVDKNKYPNVKFTKYGTATIGGNIHDLTVDFEYMIYAHEKNGARGYMYNVTNIRSMDLKSESDVYTFLQEILTFNQASELYREYPNIVDLVVSNQADKTVDLKRLHGIGPYIFELIKEKIIQNYGMFDFINEFKGVLTITMVRKLYDKYVSIEKLRQEMKEDPYKCLCDISRVGFKTADDLLLRMEKENIITFPFDLKTSKQRCIACIKHLLSENETNGNTKMSIPDLRNQVMKFTPACSEHFVICLNENQEDIYYNKDNLDIAFRTTYETELYNANVIIDALNISNKWDIDWESYRNKGEFPLTDEQTKALKLVCRNQISILSGFGGSGKTSVTNTLIRMLIENGKSFALCSPTGKAAKVLSSYTGMPAATIHRTYKYQPGKEDDKNGGWGINEEFKINKDIIICDEASMVDVFLFKHLLEGIDFHRTKLLLIGDPAQLCSVSSGNVLHDLINSKIIPTVTLTKIFRYDDGGLMMAATDTRNMKQFLKESPENKYVFLGNNKDFGFLQCDNDKLLKNIKNLYQELLNQGESASDIMVLSAYNKGDFGTVNINNMLQKVVNAESLNSETFMTIGDRRFYQNDIVIETKNNYHAKICDEFGNYIYDLDGQPKETLVANGETMTVVSIDKLYAILDLDGATIKYERDDMEHVSLAYSISVHRSQGSAAKIVIQVVSPSHTFMLNSNLLYVGFTRARKRCFAIGDLTTVNRAIKKKEEYKRNTFMLNLLIKNIDQLCETC